MIFQTEIINENEENIMFTLSREETTEFKVKNSSYFDFAGQRSQSLSVA
jgi:hypothetical protein